MRTVIRYSEVFKLQVIRELEAGTAYGNSYTPLTYINEAKMAKKNNLQKINKTFGEAVSPLWIKVFVWGVVGCAVLLALFAFGLMDGRSADVSLFAAQGWGEYAGVIVDNKIRALWHAAIMTSSVAGFFWLFLLAKPKKSIAYKFAAWGLLLLVAGDAWLLSRYYVKTMPMAALNENAVITILKKDMPEHRVALVSHDGFYNWWLTYLFPFHNIQTVNITQMPRMPNEYKQFLSAVGRDPIRFWQLAAVSYVLAPARIQEQLQRDSALRDMFEVCLTYNVSPGPEGSGVVVIPAMPKQPGQHIVLRFKQPGPRYALFAGVETCADEDALHRLADPGMPPFRKVYLAPECATNVPALTGVGMVGEVESLDYRPGRFHLKTACAQPAVLRIAEKFDKDWKAEVDGNPMPVLRVDYIFQGIYLTTGTHEVILKYAPATWPLFVQLSGMGVCFCVVIWLFIRKFLGRAKLPYTSESMA